MARIGLPKVDTAGVYAHLRRFFEADLEWGANVAQAHAAGAPFPRQRILDDLRAWRRCHRQLSSTGECALPPARP